MQPFAFLPAWPRYHIKKHGCFLSQNRLNTNQLSNWIQIQYTIHYLCEYSYNRITDCGVSWCMMIRNDGAMTTAQEKDNTCAHVFFLCCLRCAAVPYQYTYKMNIRAQQRSANSSSAVQSCNLRSCSYSCQKMQRWSPLEIRYTRSVYYLYDCPRH